MIDKKLGDAEVEIMQILWDAKEPLTSKYIQEQLRDSRDWKLSTVMSVLARLVEKKFVYCDRTTRTNYYTPCVTEHEYKNFESKHVLNRLFGNSVSRMVANLYAEHDLTKEDIQELKQMLDSFDGEHKND